MNVLFLCQEMEMPSSRIRVSNLLPEIRKAGICAEAKVYPKGLSDKILLWRDLRKFDIVYLQKKLPSPIELKLLRSFSRLLIFDFDDAIYYRDDSHASFESRSRRTKFGSIAKAADMVIAGNRVLADYADKYNNHVLVLPSSVETRGTPVRDHAGGNRDIVIGWVGGKGNLRHLAMLSETFQRLACSCRFRLRVICSDTVQIPGVQVDFVPWDLETQEKEISLFDIGVMPLPLNKWSEGKCAYKALQYMAAGVPPVVSDVGINRDVVGHGKEGLVVPAPEGFHDAIRSLLENKEQRIELGRNARIKAETHYSVEVIGKNLADLLLSMPGK
ncbi:MAG: glycosyltransferase family 4 protein [Nitrospirae bacterium]|nr:glycosyltransferase family 4 protein [Nitrospirota bacterium]